MESGIILKNPHHYFHLQVNSPEGSQTSSLAIFILKKINWESSSEQQKFIQKEISASCDDSWNVNKEQSKLVKQDFNAVAFTAHLRLLSDHTTKPQRRGKDAESKKDGVAASRSQNDGQEEDNWEWHVQGRQTFGKA